MPAALTRRAGGEGDTEIILEFCFARLNDGPLNQFMLLCGAKRILHNNLPVSVKSPYLRVAVGRHAAAWGNFHYQLSTTNYHHHLWRCLRR